MKSGTGGPARAGDGRTPVPSRVGAATAGGDPAGNLGSRLRQARIDAHMTVRELARQLGVSASHVSQLENGKSQPSVATLYSLAQFLGVSIDRLFENPDDVASPTADTSGADTQVGARPDPPTPASDTGPEKA